MKIKRLKKIRINSYIFDVEWDKTLDGGYFSYGEKRIVIGTSSKKEMRIFEILNHELFEICAVEMNVRLHRPDCDSDYIFVYDHRQHETIVNMFTGALSEFL